MIHHKFLYQHTNKEIVSDRNKEQRYINFDLQKIKDGKIWDKDAKDFDVTKARKEHKCQLCKKRIKKSELYLRRSFGRIWTIKACSPYCFSLMLVGV